MIFAATMVKDYYHILNVPPDANEGTIKRQFRKMALRYHPDTNPGNPYADAWYREIQEAYETLTNPELKKRYLQQRWLMKSMGKALTPLQLLTPDFIYLTCHQFAQSVAEIDIYRMSSQQVEDDFMKLLNTDRLDALKKYEHQGFNRKIVDALLPAMDVLEYEFTQKPVDKLFEIAKQDGEYTYKIAAYLKKRRKQYVTEKYQIWFVLLITAVLCLVIYFAG